mmetsp:Transcript_23878/g.36292  ORF Transcript_23878/g.36292 Transcript_23878/m.36292 type:complete len:89 (+) Transcript_23878:1433-1699(+)
MISASSFFTATSTTTSCCLPSYCLPTKLSKVSGPCWAASPWTSYKMEMPQETKKLYLVKSQEQLRCTIEALALHGGVVSHKLSIAVCC